jgi:hypothetical protein
MWCRGAESRSIPVYGEESDAALIPKPDVFTYIRCVSLPANCCKAGFVLLMIVRPDGDIPVHSLYSIQYTPL